MPVPPFLILKDKNSLWNEANIQKERVVCQERKSQDMGYFFHRQKAKGFVTGIAETKNKEERNLPY